MCGRGNEYQDFWKSFNSLFSVCNVEFTDACRTGSVEEAENLKAALSLDEVKKIVNQHSSQESLFFRYLTSFFCPIAHTSTDLHPSLGFLSTTEVGSRNLRPFPSM